MGIRFRFEWRELNGKGELAQPYKKGSMLSNSKLNPWEGFSTEEEAEARLTTWFDTDETDTAQYVLVKIYERG